VVTTSETVEGGGKGGGGGDQTVTSKSYRYYADIALGLCEGPITSVYRIWVDNQPDLRRQFGGPSTNGKVSSPPR
jgi:hypothetical protein